MTLEIFRDIKSGLHFATCMNSIPYLFTVVCSIHRYNQAISDKNKKSNIHIFHRDFFRMVILKTGFLLKYVTIDVLFTCMALIASCLEKNLSVHSRVHSSR